MPRTLLQIYLDAFFCAVEENQNPALRGRAFAVGGKPEERGVVASCSYAARRMGVRSAMPMSKAIRLCPGLVTVPSRHGLYSEVSRQVMGILRAQTPLVEQISIDEAFLDISDIQQEPERFGSRLNVSILGRPELSIEFPNIADRFAPYLTWLDHPEVLSIHFEDLINDRSAALSRIAEHLLARVSLQAPRSLILDALEASINPQRSPTFRSGKTGEWQKYFTGENKKIFKDVAGDLLIRLGYETNNDW